MSADQTEASQVTTQIPSSLRRALEERETDPLVRIAAARVLKRFPWRREAAEKAHVYYQGLTDKLQEEVQKAEFFPAPELRRALQEMVRPAEKREKKDTRRILEWSIEQLQNASQERELGGQQTGAIEEAVQFLGAKPREAAFFPGEKITSLSPEELGYFATGGFARTTYAAYGKDEHARQVLGNKIVSVVAPAWSLLRPQIEPLFRVYLSLFPEAETFWLNWLEDHEGKTLPNSIPATAGQLSVSWQVSWAASAAKAIEFLEFLDQALKPGNERRRLAALNFTESAIRFGADPRIPVFGGTTIAPDVEGIEMGGSISGTVSVGVVSLGTIRVPSVDGPHASAPAAAPGSAPANGEAHVEKSLPTPSRAIPADEPPVALNQVPSEPGKRYADFTFFRRGDGGAKIKVLDHEPLGKDQNYDLEVAVRAKASGIPMKEKKGRLGISEPQQGKPVQVLVIAISEDFLIPEPVQWLELPLAGDSFKNATFEKLKPLRETPFADTLAKIQVRLLYNLNLLEQVVIEAEVIPTLPIQASSKLGLEHPIVLDQELSMREYHNFDLIQARQMNIVVKRVTGGFDLSFTLLRDGRANEVLTGVTRISENDLEKSLMDIRQTLLGISVWDEFANATECADEMKFQQGLGKLAEKGRALWVKLFEYKIKSSLTSIGKLFLDNPLTENALVQISIDSNASRFVLPWNLLYDQKPARGNVDPKGFWGLRYRIEQEIEDSGDRSDAARILTEELEIGFLVSRFKEEELQRTFLTDSANASKGRIGAIHPIDSAEEALNYLKTKVAQLVLFFAHGHTEFAEAERVGGSNATFLVLYEKLPEKSPLKAAWKDIYDDIKGDRYESDESWIKLQYGKLFLPQLYDELDESFAGAPIVFLNMCESAQLTPSLSASFIHLFLDRGACAVIGTECSMRPLFAHYFAEEILKGLFAGEGLGDVMLKARLQFMAKKNPLGLAYTLFGSPLTRFEPPPLALAEGSATNTNHPRGRLWRN